MGAGRVVPAPSLSCVRGRVSGDMTIEGSPTCGSTGATTHSFRVVHPDSGWRQEPVLELAAGDQVNGRDTRQRI